MPTQTKKKEESRIFMAAWFLIIKYYILVGLKITGLKKFTYILFLFHSGFFFKAGLLQ